MSLSYTYATLSTALKNTIDGDTSSTGGLASATNLDNIIKAGEERILSELPLVVFDAEATVTLTINVATVDKPSGYLTWRSANFTDGSSNKVQLDLRTLEYLEDYWPNSASTGTPKFLADYSSTQWKVAPTPAATRSGKAIYVKRPTSLVTDTAGTWISQNLGLLLYSACLANGEKFIKSDERASFWEADYQRAYQAALIEFRHMLRPGFSPVAAMPTAKEER